MSIICWALEGYTAPLPVFSVHSLVRVFIHLFIIMFLITFSSNFSHCHLGAQQKLADSGSKCTGNIFGLIRAQENQQGHVVHQIYCTAIRSASACTRPPLFTMLSQIYCNPPSFAYHRHVLSPRLSFLFMPVVQKDRCADYLFHDVNDRIHQFLASVVMKQLNTRQQANPLCLHCLEEAQCVSGVLPSLFCKYTSELHCPKRDTIWSGLQVKQDSEFSWKWCRTEGGDRRLQTSVLRRGRTPRAEPPRPFVLH